MKRDKEALKASRKGIEIWRDIPEYEGWYKVSNLGRVRSLHREVPDGKGGYRTIKTKIITNTLDKNYLVVVLHKKNMNRKFRVHRLVLLAFCGPIPDGKETRHLDGDTKNNCLYNIKYGTGTENSDDKIKHGTKLQGEIVKTAVLTEKEVRKIKIKLKNYYIGLGVELAYKYGVTPANISYIRAGKSWAHVTV